MSYFGLAHVGVTSYFSPTRDRVELHPLQGCVMNCFSLPHVGVELF